MIEIKIPVDDERGNTMTIRELQTPAILLDLDVMEHNLKKAAELAEKYGKQLWPMTKTHKSTALFELQAKYGASGFLCGTLDECEAACRAGFSDIMYAYPAVSPVWVARIVDLAKKCRFIARIDSREGAEVLNAAALEADLRIGFTVIVDSGLHRFGILPEQMAEFLKPLLELPGLEFCGISSHAGQVYGASRPEQVAAYAAEESAALALAVSQVRGLGIEPEIVSTGSTPTFPLCAADENINLLHPGNYIFNDCIQISTDTAKEEECALTVLASVISHPSEDLFICDAGAKCLGLDAGAHGNASVVGHGRVIDHPELVVESLSEEVGKLRVKRTDENAAQQAAARKSERSAAGTACGLKVGDLIRIIPNHACSTANLTDYYVGVRGDGVERLIEVDIRGNKTAKGFL